MSKRLQVLLEESEWREIQRAARATRVTIAEWVRQALRAARASAPVGDIGKKLDVIRAATRHAYPTGDIEQMLTEIEHGYLTDGPR
jgi:hypothetical protein